MFDMIYKQLDKLTAKTPLTPLGWFVIAVLILTPLFLGCVCLGYNYNRYLIELQSRTNGMEHTTNYQVLHQFENGE